MSATKIRIPKHLKSSYDFFMKHAGYATPPGRESCALAMARAEYEAKARGWEVFWDFDPCGCNGCDCKSDDCACSSGAEHETLDAVLRLHDSPSSPVLASLGGICFTQRFRSEAKASAFASDKVYYGKPATVNMVDAPMRLVRRWGV